MKRVSVVLCVLMAASFLFFACGGGGGGGSHSLEADWAGYWFFRSDPSELELTVDGSGDITDFLADGSPVDFEEAWLDDNPEIYTMTMSQTSGTTFRWPFISDSRQDYGVLITLDPDFHIPLFGVLERDGVFPPLFFDGDILASWSGTAYAYSPAALGLAPLSAQFEAEDGVPATFTITLPGETVTGELLQDTPNPVLTGGDGDGGEIIIFLMSPDKQFLGAVLIPPGAQDYDDFIFLLLTRD